MKGTQRSAERPEEVISLTSYAQLDLYLAKFTAGDLGLVLLLGRHGTGKTRAGLEPAEDMKRTLAAACRDVRLDVSKAQMALLRDRDARSVMVYASLPSWQHEMPMVTVQTWVTASGETSPIEIFCQANRPEEDPLGSAFTAPVMQGSKNVPPDRLVDHLQQTLVERAQVLRALACGETAPFTFDDTVWDLPQLGLL